MPLLGALGAAVLFVALVDMARTTVAVSVGGGPVTSRLAHWHWVLWRSLADRVAHPHRLLRAGGLFVVIGTLLTWVAAVWLGWSLVFASATDAVRHATSHAIASGFDRVYFAGYTMLTTGNGGFVPGAGVWQVLTVVASFSGLAVVTMGITYLVPIVSSVVEGRTLALHISSLGDDPYELLTSCWADGSWGRLTETLDALTPELLLLGQRHLAYPVLHYFHNTDARAAPAVAVGTLDEALTLLEHGVAVHARPDRVSLRLARNGIGSLLGALQSAFMTPADDPPAPLRLEPLERAGIPTVDQDDFAAACDDLARHRRQLRGLVEDAGWSWPDVSPDRDREERTDGDEGENVQQATERSA